MISEEVSAVENLIKSLEIKAGVMEMGERIAWGSDTALIYCTLVHLHIAKN